MADTKTLKDIRQKFPQYSDLSDADLADAIHKKFYSDMPRADFDKKIGLKSEAPVAMEDPGFFGRVEQRSKQFQQGIEAPALPADAGSGARVADALMNAHDFLGNATNTVSRGLTMGFSDDAAALGTATGKAFDGVSIKDVMDAHARGESAPSFGGDFRAANALENEKIRKFKDDHPVLGNTLGIGGALFSPAGQAGGNYVSQGTNWLSRAARSAVPGGILGLIGGGGYSEGDLGDRATGALTGGAAGLVLSPLATAGTEALMNVGGRVIDASRNVINAYRDPNYQANRLLAQALARDNVTPRSIAAQVRQAGPEGIVDLAGPNTAALGRQATVAPGNARTVAQDFFDGRRADAGNRTKDVLAAMIPENADDEIARLGVQKARDAAPLYAASNAADPESLATPYVQEVLQSPIGKQALTRGQRIWEADRIAGRVSGDPFTPMLDAEGNLTTQTAPDMRILDYMKRGMDQMVDEAYNTSRTAGNAMKAARDAFRQHLRDINPAYGQALDAYSGPSHAQDLMQEGMDFFKGRVQESVRRIGQLTGDDLAAYRIGAVRAAMDKLDNVTDAGSVYAALGNSDAKRQQLRALFPNRADFDNIFNQLLRERNLMNVERTVLGGSPTSRIDADKADAADTVGLIGNLLDLVRNPGSGIGALMTRAANPARGVTEPVAERLGGLLFNADPAVKQQVIQRLLSAPNGGQGLLPAAILGMSRNDALIRQLAGGAARLTGQGAGAAAGSIR